MVERPHIHSERLIAGPVDDIFAFLENLEHHWQLNPRFRVLNLRENDGATVQLRGPFGITRTAHTTVRAVTRPLAMHGTARSGRALAAVSWALTPIDDRSTRVRLEIRLDEHGPLDRLLLRLGGGAWLRRQFDGILATLEQRVAAYR